MRAVFNKIDVDKRRSAQLTRSEIANLKAELQARDRMIYELQNATIELDTDRIWELEQQIDDLKSELDQRTSAEQEQTQAYDWTLAARDPFDDDNFMDLVPDDTHFGDATVAQLTCGTPMRAEASFPTPPPTSPTVPMTLARGTAWPQRRLRTARSGLSS